MTNHQRAVLDYNKLCVILILGAIVYNEFLCYLSAYSRWPSIKAPSDSLRILFVADPQILGSKYESTFPTGSITRWDGDRYLSKSFSWAVSAYNPQVVVFLGDLIDEGSESDEETFKYHAERFKAIYDFRSVKTSIYIAGDNDVGGEGGDPITDEKIQRFKDRFPPKPVYIFRGTSGVDISSVDEALRNSNSEVTTVEIIPVSLLTQKNPSEWGELNPPSKHTFRIVVSHLPVLTTQNSQFSVTVLSHVQPSVIFSAHDHKGMDYVGTRKTGLSTGNFTFFSQKYSEEHPEFLLVKSFQSSKEKSEEDTKAESPRDSEVVGSDSEDNQIHEIVVPTCSYRMGVKEMAFGFGLINMKGSGPPELLYTNLWLPSRFALLYIYIATILCAFVLLCMGRCQAGKRGRRNSRGVNSGRRSASGSPSPGSKYSKLV